MRQEPREPADLVLPRFPWIPVMTPIILSVVMAALFRSPLALVMGVLGPAMVLGSWWESRRSQYKQHEREQENFAREVELFDSQQHNNRTRVCDEAHREHPALLAHLRDPFWRDGNGLKDEARLGTGWWTPPRGHTLEGEESIPAMPGVVESHRGIALVGPEDAAATWRLILAQWILRATSEQRTTLPPGVLQGGDIPRSFRGKSLAVWAASVQDVPAECQIIVVWRGSGHLDVRDSAGITRTLWAEGLSQSEFSWVATKLLPVGDEDQATETIDPSRRDQLFVDVGDAKPWDLVAEGPHAVVWGATGSGKSVTLSSMVLSLAARYSPSRMVVVVVDFKGGAGLSVLAGLPHLVGSVTDLDTERASRALAGLAREMVAREHLLAAHSVADISALAPSVACPRLVLAVDEAAWLLETFPAWSATLADVVARGRSLGIHVLIATQRIQGVLGPAVMANIALRVCGRVSDTSEVTSWLSGISSERVESLRNARAGAGIAAGALKPPTDVAVRPAAAPDVSHREPATWRVWAEELPATVRRTGGAWCLVDDRAERVHHPRSYSPEVEGSVLVIGDRRSGKTTALAALAAGCSAVSVVAPEPFAAWLQLAGMKRHQLCIIDNADHLFNRTGAEGAQLLWEELNQRVGPVLLSAQADSPHIRSLARFAAQHLVLSIAKPEASLAWGGWGPTVPGRGHYDGQTIQVVSGVAMPATLPTPGEPSGATSVPPLVLSQEPRRWEGVPIAWAGQPENLLAQWSRFSPVLHETPVLLDGVSARDAHQATTGRVRVPALPVPEGMVAGSWKGQVFLTRPERWRR